MTLGAYTFSKDDIDHIREMAASFSLAEIAVVMQRSKSTIRDLCARLKIKAIVKDRSGAVDPEIAKARRAKWEASMQRQMDARREARAGFPDYDEANIPPAGTQLYFDVPAEVLAREMKGPPVPGYRLQIRAQSYGCGTAARLCVEG